MKKIHYLEVEYSPLTDEIYSFLLCGYKTKEKEDPYSFNLDTDIDNVTCVKCIKLYYKKYDYVD